MTDAELIEQYAETKSEAAFHTLVERYLPLVYSGAVRQVRNAAMADDVAQVVFIILARKAAQLSRDTILPAWLFRTTRHVARRAMRTELRRQQREQEAIQMQSAEQTDSWEQAAPFLDDALARLGEVDRGAILLHYFEKKRLREVGLALGMSEDTAQKRVARAIEKLRNLLFKRGVLLSTAVIPGLLLTRGATAAPVYLSAKIVACALNKTVVSTSVYAVLQDSNVKAFFPSGKLAFSAAASLVVALIGAAYLWARPLHPPGPPPQFGARPGNLFHARRRVIAKPAPPVRVSPPAPVVTVPPVRDVAPPAPAPVPVVAVLPVRPLVPTNTPVVSPPPDLTAVPSKNAGSDPSPRNYDPPLAWPQPNGGSPPLAQNSPRLPETENPDSNNTKMSPLIQQPRPVLVPRSNLQKKKN